MCFLGTLKCGILRPVIPLGVLRVSLGDEVTKDSTSTAHKEARFVHVRVYVCMCVHVLVYEVPFVCSVACGGQGTTLSFLRFQLFSDDHQPCLFIIIS